jgi:DNA-binding NtrC family response regulator
MAAFASRQTGGSWRAFFRGTMKNFTVLRVLVVEDERLIRWSIAETLIHAGHQVIEADCAAAAVSALTNGTATVDAVLLDYRLPDSNDMTLLSNIRRLSPASAVVMMTAFGTPDMTKDALALGVYKVIDKPFDMDDLTPLLMTAHAAGR